MSLTGIYGPAGAIVSGAPAQWLRDRPVPAHEGPSVSQVISSAATALLGLVLAGLASLAIGCGYRGCRREEAPADAAPSPVVLPVSKPSRELDVAVADLLKKKAATDFEFPPNLPVYASKVYPSVGEALKEGFMGGSRVVSFGELHGKRGYQGRYAVPIFLTQILPRMAERGYRDLVLEKLPSDFQEVTTMKPKISDHINWLKEKKAFAGEEIEPFLDACFKYGIRVHGGDLTIQESKNLLREKEASGKGADVSRFTVRAANLAQRRMEEAIRKVAQVRPVMSYGGCFHVSPFPDITGFHDASYGATLSAHLNKKGDSYTAVILHFPSQVSAYIGTLIRQGYYDPIFAQPLWYFLHHKMVPPQDHVSLALAQQGNSRISHLIFPWDKK